MGCVGDGTHIFCETSPLTTKLTMVDSDFDREGAKTLGTTTPANFDPLRSRRGSKGAAVGMMPVCDY